MAAERQIKGWSRAKKEALVDQRWDELSRLSRSRTGVVLRQAQDERILIAGEVLEAMIHAAERAHPEEACGILLGSGLIITGAMEAQNVHPTPNTHFEIDPRVLIDVYRAEREGGPKVIGYYHSHPSGPAHPSATDQEQAAGDGKVWAIIGQDEVRFWKDLPDGFQPLSYSIVGR